MTSDADKRSSLHFTPITLPQMERVEAIRAASGSTLHVYSFASLFSWQENERYGICLSEDAFLIKYAARGENAYLFPCGTRSGKKRLIDALLTDISPVFYYVGDEDVRFLEEEYPGRFLFCDCRDDYPYLYDREAQIALSGKDYKSLRHQIHLGESSAHTWKTEMLTAKNAERALCINRKWANARFSGEPADTAAAETALLHFEELHLWGVLFQADGEDIAYAAGTFITPEIFDICFCKVLDQNCDCYIKWALYRLLPEEVKTVDSEEDMGLEGLRTHKLLRRPKELTRVRKGILR